MHSAQKFANYFIINWYTAAYHTMLIADAAAATMLCNRGAYNIQIY